MNADHQRVAPITGFTLKVKRDFCRKFLKSVFICVHPRFNFLDRVIQIKQKEAKGTKALFRRFLRFLRELLFKISSSPPESSVPASMAVILERKLEPQMNAMNADHQRVAPITGFTLKVKRDFFRKFLKSVLICVHPRFNSLDRVIQIKQKEAKGTKVLCRRFLRFLRELLFKISSSPPESSAGGCGMQGER